MPDQRKYQRTSMSARIMVRHPDIGERVFQMRDLSDGGIFVVVERGDFPEVGCFVEVQVQGLPVAAPVRQMRVVRSSGEGFGLEFVD